MGGEGIPLIRIERKEEAMRIIIHLIHFHISCLLRRDEKWKEQLEPISNKFGNDFVNHVTKSNRSEFFRFAGLLLFWYQQDEGGIEGG